MKIDSFLYKNRCALNVLANSIENAKDVYEAAEGYVLVGVLSKDYSTVEEGLVAMREYDQAIEGAVSVGLGAGDNRQAAVVEEIVKQYPGTHINQVFPSVGATRANIDNQTSWINALVSPTGQVGMVNIATGPYSSASEQQAVIPVETAIGLVRDMGGNALKFFPMGGLASVEEYKAVAKACAEAQFALEPTGGIDLDNFEEIVRIALEAGVPKVIPHVYSSIIDSQTGKTNVADVKQLCQTMKNLVDSYE